MIRFLLVGLWLLSTIANAGIKDDMQQTIQQEFNTRYKNNHLNVMVKDIYVVYDEEVSTMGIKCDKQNKIAIIAFGPNLILHSQQVKNLVSVVLAHELGHCHHEDGLQDHDKEYFADSYGAGLYISSGGTLEEVVERFKELDYHESPTHPSAKKRYENLMGKEK